MNLVKEIDNSQKTENQEILNRVYQKNPLIEYEENNHKISIIFRNNHWLQRTMRKVKMRIPQISKLELDEICSVVFKSIDGKRTVQEIGKILRETFGEEIEPLYERLLTFINFLEDQKHYIEIKHT